MQLLILAVDPFKTQGNDDKNLGVLSQKRSVFDTLLRGMHFITKGYWN